MTPKGYDVFNDFHRFLLVDGPRKSSKTLSILNKLCRHMYENPGTVVGMITKTARNAKSGVWRDLIEFTLPQWIKGGFGFQFVSEPKIAVDTKMTSFKIRSRTGESSECQLHSLEYAKDAEMKFKSTRFGLVYLSEADLWEDRIIFDVLSDQLRMVHMTFDAHQLIVDCNPPETGDDHWLYDLFFREGGVEKPMEEKSEFQRSFHRIQVKLEDNTLIDPREIRELKEKYLYDQNLTDRWVHGLWVRSTQSTIFKDVWRKDFHVVGTCKGHESEWEIIIPDGQSPKLFSGWDMGDSNHAGVILSNRESDHGLIWEAIDEIVVLDRQVSIADFTAMFEERMDYWESVLEGEYGITKVDWVHMSDSSAFRFKAAADSYDELIVRDVSEGRIALRGVTKGRWSVRNRVSILKKLLFQNRLLVSARCKHLIQMFHHLPPGKKNVGGGPESELEAVDSTSPHKHVFDAVSYLLGTEEPLELVRRRQPKIAKVMFMTA